MSAPAAEAPVSRAVAPDRPLPPITHLSVASLVLVFAGGVYLAAHIPARAPLGPAIGFLAGAWALLAVNVALVVRIRPFAWSVFRQVAAWALLAYAVFAGLLEYVVVYDHTPGSTLLVTTLMLGVYAVNIPVLLGFSVARYQPPDGS